MMIKSKRVLFFCCFLAIAAAGCSKHENQSANESSSTPTQKSAYAAPLPNVGKIKTVYVTATGTGMTRNDAINDAVKNAILQEYGEKVDLNSVKYRAALHVADNMKSKNIDVEWSGSAVRNATNGLLTSLKVLKVKKPELFGLLGKNYTVTISAAFPKFSGPKSPNLLKIVIGQIKTNGNSFVIGGQTIPASTVVSDIHQQLVTALSQTGRFVVLDRSFGSSINDELSLISEGQTPEKDYAKLGQVTSADVIWVGSINTFGYYRHAQNLSISSRQLVSYSGGWSLSERLVDVANRQIVAADTLQGRPPSIAPTTLGTNFNASNTETTMVNDMVHKIIASILMREYPITILQKEGNQVVLSQGGDSVLKGAVYRVVAMGKELTDPQTGQSLGRTQTPFGKVVIDRVTPTLSYGHLIDVDASSTSIAPGELQVGRMLSASYVKVNNPPAHMNSSSAHPIYYEHPSQALPAENTSPPRKHDPNW
ncbi:CsgG/HfaB family protein [Candidatus Igneacidithiobacillus taiwanensis]|uniref:CsgG/HfaB family protein n=1 Tax=Candidatus Igneacidithiobacillus taiwanensis TaxID=1945924 RepID=UPI002898A7D6|nr:CsgG/HfaB family protein [Candidatus Igneacidithiobacillus taiwanensis]